MQGCIRIIFGCLMALGGVGGLNNEVSIFIPFAIIVIGLIIAWWGESSFQKQHI